PEPVRETTPEIEAYLAEVQIAPLRSRLYASASARDTSHVPEGRERLRNAGTFLLLRSISYSAPPRANSHRLVRPARHYDRLRAHLYARTICLSSCHGIPGCRRLPARLPSHDYAANLAACSSWAAGSCWSQAARYTVPP